MRSALVLGGVALGAALLSACSVASPTSAAASADEEALAAIAQHPTRRACATPVGAFGFTCAATVRTDVRAGFTPDFAATATSDPPSYGPKELAAAYSIPKGGAGITVAVIEAKDDPEAEADLAVYRARYGLAPCTVAGGCFTKVNAGGQTSPLPGGSYEAAQETTLDLDAVSAGCPACSILVVEADVDIETGGARDPFGEAVDTAVRLGAKFVALGYGTSEATTEANGGVTRADALAQVAHYRHPGVAIFAASGDAGFATSPDNTYDFKGPTFPADVPEVFAVGGTSLVSSTKNARGWSEGVWGPGGLDGASNSGCSQFFPKPSYQTSTACSGREITDLSALADPSTGLNVYLTYVDPDTAARDHLPPGWNVFGGTALASALTAAIFAASGLEGVDPSFAYQHAAWFHDVTAGSNGTCKETSLCHARAGYDAPSGNGTPDGALLNGQ